jgi:uncharacterized protein
MALIDQLHELFLLDQRARGMRGRLDAAIRRQTAQQTRLDQLNRQHQELHQLLLQTQAKAGDLESQSLALEERVEKHRQQMNSVTSNREYKALLVEVNTLKTEKGKAEEAALEQMTEVDRIKGELAELEARIAEQTKLVAGAEKDVADARSEVGEELDALTAQRDATAEEIPPDVRATFDRLADSYDGEALAKIVEASRRNREYTCGGCYMSIPVERLNALMMGRDQITFCPSCNRILFLDTELKESLAAK